jgi:hypothetical protein
MSKQSALNYVLLSTFRAPSLAQPWKEGMVAVADIKVVLGIVTI